MSMHKQPLTTLEREGLEKHGLPILVRQILAALPVGLAGGLECGLAGALRLARGGGVCAVAQLGLEFVALGAGHRQAHRGIGPQAHGLRLAGQSIGHAPDLGAFGADEKVQASAVE